MLFLDTLFRMSETSDYDVRHRYPVHASIFMSEDGKYTTSAPSNIIPRVVGMVVRAPTEANPKLKLAIFRK